MGSPGGRAGGPGTAGLDKSCLGAVLGWGGSQAAGVKDENGHECAQCTKGGCGWQGAGAVRLCRGLGLWSVDWTHMGHQRPQPVPRTGAKPCSVECGLACHRGREGVGDRQFTHLRRRGLGEKISSEWGGRGSRVTPVIDPE